MVTMLWLPLSFGNIQRQTSAFSTIEILASTGTMSSSGRNNQVLMGHRCPSFPSQPPEEPLRAQFTGEDSSYPYRRLFLDCLCGDRHKLTWRSVSLKKRFTRLEAFICANLMRTTIPPCYVGTRMLLHRNAMHEDLNRDCDDFGTMKRGARA